MFFFNFSVKKLIVMIVILIVLMVLGLMVFSKLCVNQILDVEQFMLVVNILYLGVLLMMVECEIINWIEKLLQSISGIDEVCLMVSEGNVQILLIYQFNKNMIEVVDEVCNVIGIVCYKLLIEMCELVLQCFDLLVQLIM